MKTPEDEEFDAIDERQKLAFNESANFEITERNFCPRCGKRTKDLTVIHTCTPPQGEKN